MRGASFEEYDVETDAAARARMRALAGAERTVPDPGGGRPGRAGRLAGTRLHGERLTR